MTDTKERYLRRKTQFLDSTVYIPYVYDASTSRDHRRIDALYNTYIKYNTQNEHTHTHTHTHMHTHILNAHTTIALAQGPGTQRARVAAQTVAVRECARTRRGTSVLVGWLVGWLVSDRVRCAERGG